MESNNESKPEFNPVELYDQNEAIIAEVTDACKDIAIAGVEDQENYLAAKTAAMTLQKMRKAIEDRRKLLKEESLRRGQAIDKRANQLKALIEPIEDKLKSMISGVEEEREKIKLREKRAALLPMRREKLQPYSDLQAFADDELLLMDDMQFLQAVSGLAERRNAILEEENRKAREEKERQEAEQRRALEIEQAAENARREAEQKAAAESEKKIILSTAGARIQTLIRLGHVQADAAFTEEQNMRLGKMTDAEFDVVLNEYARRAEEKAQKEKEEREAQAQAMSERERVLQWAARLKDVMPPLLPKKSKFFNVVDAVRKSIEALEAI